MQIDALPRLAKSSQVLACIPVQEQLVMYALINQII